MGSLLNNIFAVVSQYTGRHDERLYDVINTEQGYEERRYRPCTWASTTISGVYHERAKFEGFRRLGEYVSEVRDQGIDITMAPPILTRVEPKSGGASFDSMFTVSVLLSTSVTHPPTPPVTKTPNVFIEHSPETTVFVRAFQGLVNDEKWAMEARTLADTLQSKEHITTEFYLTASYDSPLQLVGTLNEIWIVKRGLRKKENNMQSKMNKLADKCKSMSKQLPSAEYQVQLKPSGSFFFTVFTWIMAFFTTCSRIITTVYNTGKSLANFGHIAVSSVSSLNDISASKLLYFALYLNKNVWLSLSDACVYTFLSFANYEY